MKRVPDWDYHVSLMFFGMRPEWRRHAAPPGYDGCHPGAGMMDVTPARV